MNKPRTLGFTGFLFALLAFFSVSGVFAQELVGKVGEWEITQTYNEGAFEVCAATKPYTNGEAVIFYAQENFLAVGLLLERWILDDRDAYDIALQFDGGQRWPAQALKGEDGKSVLIDWDFSGNIAEIQKASNLFLHTAAGSLRFNISDVSPALDRLLECRLANLPEPAN